MRELFLTLVRMPLHHGGLVDTDLAKLALLLLELGVEQLELVGLALRLDAGARLLARDGFGFDSPPTPSSRAAAALGSAETRSRGRTGALPFGALPFSLERRENEAASPAAVTAKSPRARKREWVA